MAEHLVLPEDLVDDLRGATGEQCTALARPRVEGVAVEHPATWHVRGEVRGVVRVERVTGGLGGLGHVEVRGDADPRLRDAGGVGGGAVQLDERPEPGGGPEDGQIHRQAEAPARTADSGVPPTASHTGSSGWAGRGQTPASFSGGRVVPCQVTGLRSRNASSRSRRSSKYSS